MQLRPSVIMIEFNELCPSLMKRFIESGHLPHFKRFYKESEIYVTDAEEEGENLNPWVQWVTVYSGLCAKEHNIKTLSEGHLLTTKAIWDLLSDAGYRVWVCGSMNPRYDVPLNGCLLPDPWSTGIIPYPPDEWEVYHNYIRSAVQEHTNESGENTISHSKFLTFMLRRGLSLETIFKTAHQLVSERIANTHWKRATIMDQCQWDVFRHYYNKIRPHFSTFFLNSTAHFQHSYWRDMEPERFLHHSNNREQSELKNAILYGYKNMDELMGRFMKLAGTETTLIFCTALSQQPYLDYESTGGRHYYRLQSEKALVDHLGITQRFSYEPIMAEQFYLRFNSEEEAQQAEQQLRAYRVQDKRVFSDDRTRLFHMARNDQAILIQCRCTSAVPHDVVITSEDSSKCIPFFDVFYQVNTVKSGRHHPDGLLWIRHLNRNHIVYEQKVSIRSIAPTVLKMFNMPIPSYMTSQPLTLGLPSAREQVNRPFLHCSTSRAC
jgi:hypothetical protein